MRNEKGQFLKGNGGRPKGTQSLLRQKVKEFAEANINDLQTWFDKLSEKEKINCLLQILPFAIAKLQTVSINETDNEGNPMASKPLAIDYSKLSQNAIDEILNSLHE
ncbi:MAG: hypothetical protein O9302_08710 [Cyclobacteriaceae bacterium]|jgi:hypothetical protein|nr:hypothetical protein [Cytophagales bacterium]MCZ8328125.1 hypothetical protein [Cyclobacteriaceae bacterium]